MNDPHVEALIYVVDPNDSVDYGNAVPIEFERPGFHVRLENGHARFELTEHYPTEQEARAAVQPVVDQWIFERSIRSGHNNFTLRFGWPVIIDRQPDPPTPGVISISAHFPGSPGSITAAVTVTKQYPPPPSEDEVDIHDPDVQTMLHRFMRYRQGYEPLPSMAYFCCEVFTKRLSNDIKNAADRHKISRNLIDKVNNLSSNKGGDQARHASAIADQLTPCETRFLEKAVVAMIIRAAKVAADPNQPMEKITAGNLMEISP